MSVVLDVVLPHQGAAQPESAAGTPVADETGPPRPVIAADDCFIHFSLPEQDLSSRRLSKLLRSFEILCGFRALTPGGDHHSALVEEYIDFQKDTFLRQIRNQARSVNSSTLGSIESQFNDVFDIHNWRGTPSEFFELWLASERFEQNLLPLLEIRRGSHEFLLHAVNLAAVFGMQDFALLKDSVQWACGAMQSVLNARPKSRAVLKSGERAILRLSPELVRALSEYDTVDLVTEETKDRVVFRVKLRKHEPEA